MENNATPNRAFKQEEDHMELEEARMEAESNTTVYRVTGVTPMRIKPRTYTVETALRDYRSHFDKVCVINGWETTKLQYL